MRNHIANCGSEVIAATLKHREKQPRKPFDPSLSVAIAPMGQWSRRSPPKKEPTRIDESANANDWLD